jgi:uncharacterized membrane protein YoaK (UPF0700 family)
MTGTTTQIMIDLADMLQAPRRDNARPGTSLLGTSANIAVFAAGCAAAAPLYARVGVRCFVVPPLFGIAALCMRMAGAGNETH